jgi:allantoicase
LRASAEIPGPTETRTSLSAIAPRANAAGKSADTHTGQENRGGNWGRPGPGRRMEGGWEGEGAQTHRGHSDWLLLANAAEALTPHPFFGSPLT